MAQTIKEAPTTADMKVDAAIQHFRLGVEFCRLGNHEAARVEYEAAYGLSRTGALLHNLSMTAEKQGKLGEAIEFGEGFLAGNRGELTADDTDPARGRLLRLRDIQSGKAPRRMPGALPMPMPTPAAHGAQPTRAVGWRPPGSAFGLKVGGGAALVAGITGGAVVLSTGAQLGSGQASTLREIDAMKSRGKSLNAAAITGDIVGGVAPAAGAAWTIVDRLHHTCRERLTWHTGPCPFLDLPTLSPISGNGTLRFLDGI